MSKDKTKRQTAIKPTRLQATWSILCDKLTNEHSQLDEDDLKTALFVFQRKK